MKYALALILTAASPMVLGAPLALQGVLGLLIELVIVALIFWAIWWFIGYVGVPEPFNKVIRVLLGLVALIYIINVLLSMIGSPLFTLR